MDKSTASNSGQNGSADAAKPNKISPQTLSETQFDNSVPADSTRKGCLCKSLTEQESLSFKPNVVSSGVEQQQEAAASSQDETQPDKESVLSTKASGSTIEKLSDENSTSMLAIVISAVMLMASDCPRIPDEYLEYTKNYLECFTDSDGQLPHNIKGILNYIQYLRENGMVRPIGEESQHDIPRGSVGIAEEEEEESKTGRSSHLPKQHKEKLRIHHITQAPERYYKRKVKKKQALQHRG